MKYTKYISLIRVRDGNFRSLTDHLFWIGLMLFTDPAGICETLGLGNVQGKINFNDMTFMAISLCYIAAEKKEGIFDYEYMRVKKYFVIFIVYYFLFFMILIPLYNGSENYSLVTSLIKIRHTVYHFLLFFYIYEFYKRSWELFVRYFLISSNIVLGLFVYQMISDRQIFKLNIMNRGFIDIDRNLMLSEGIMPLLIPLGAAVLVFKHKSRYSRLIISGFVLMSTAYIFELWRRNIIATFVYLVFAIVIYAAIQKRYVFLLTKGISIVIFMAAIVLVLYARFPKYTDAAQKAIIETVSVAQKSKTTEGKSDVRLKLDRPFINNLFCRHPLWGTGFDNRWRNHEGDVQGYEAADYPFLAALAMYGIIGILMFIPIYYWLIKIVRYDIKYLVKNYSEDSGIHVFLMLAFIIFFTYHLLQYFNYFIFISFPDDFTYYIYPSLYLSARTKYYSNEHMKLKIKLSN